VKGQTVVEWRVLSVRSFLHVHEAERGEESCAEAHEELAGAEEGEGSVDDEAVWQTGALRLVHGVGAIARLAQTSSGVSYNNVRLAASRPWSDFVLQMTITHLAVFFPFIFDIVGRLCFCLNLLLYLYYDNL